MIRRPPRSTLSSSSAASDVYKRQLVNICKAELPVLLGRVDAITKAVRLLALRQMQEDLDSPGAVAMEMLLEVTDRAEPFIPEGLPVDQLTWEALVVKDLRVNADDEHVLVVGAVEDADPPDLGQSTGGTPEEVMLEFLGAGLLEAEDLTALRVHPGHDVTDSAIFASRIHPLEDQQQRMMLRCVVQPLQRAHPLDMLLQSLLVPLLV